MKTPATIAGLKYRCVECGAPFPDPDEARSFQNWEAAIRVHCTAVHGAGIHSATPLNNLVRPIFIWTTPTGAEVVTTGVR